MSAQLTSCLERIAGRTEHLRELDLSTEDGRCQALEESRALLATVALYRHLLICSKPRDLPPYFAPRLEQELPVEELSVEEVA